MSAEFDPDFGSTLRFLPGQTRLNYPKSAAMAISETPKLFSDNLLERSSPLSGCIGKGQFEIRLTEPVSSLHSQGALVNGLEELFTQTKRSATQQLIFLICSAWLSTEVFLRLLNSLKGRGHHLNCIKDLKSDAF